MHLIRGKTVHFPGKKGEIVAESTFSAGKCTKKAAKWFTFPQKTDEEYRWEQYSRGPADNAIIPKQETTKYSRETGQKRKGYAKKKKGKLNTSHRYNHLPLLPSGPGGVQWELVVYDLPECKGKHFSDIAKIFQSRLFVQIISPDYQGY